MGIIADVSLPGRSLVRGKQVRKYVKIPSGNGMMGIRTNRYKLWYNPHFKDGKMYDLVEDPQELNNLYNKQGYIELRREFFFLNYYFM